MSLSLGSALATRVYLGATEIDLAYFGATQVYTSSAFSAEAQNYFGRLDTAGDTTYVDYKLPLANYIDSLVTLGGAYWDDMKSAASFVGVGIQGVTVPLRSGMPTLTNNNFVAGDLDQLTGLLSDGSTKYLATGLTGTDLSQDDHSFSFYASSASNTGFAGGTYSTNFNRPIAIAIGPGTTNFYSTAAVDQTAKVTSAPALVGLSRSASTEYTARTNQGDETVTRTSGIPNTGGLSLFAVGAGVAPTEARLATYHAGPALDLATLEGLQDTLLSEVAVAKGAAAAANYFARLDTAGDTTYVPYKQPLTNYISSLVALGGAYWDDMLSSTSFVGVGIQGVTVPLRDGMTVPTNNNFVAGDLDQLTGLKGDGSTKYIDTGVNSLFDLSLNDASISTYLTADRDVGVTAGYIGAGASTFVVVNNAIGFRSRHFNSTLRANGTSTSVGGLIGISRDNASDYDWYDVGATGTNADASAVQSNLTVGVFATTGAGALINSSRLATYHVGPALDLATLEGLQDTLLSELAGVGFSTEAANYFGRLVNAGDSTFLAYRQPLANYIDSLVALGGAYWDNMLSAASFVGVGIQGVTVPLRDGMTVPTNNNFVAGDLNQLTGLKGDGSTKLINTGYIDSDLAQNDGSLSAYVTAPATISGTYYAGTTTAGNAGTFLRDVGTTCQLNVHGGLTSNGTAIISGLVGASRTDSTNVNARSNQTNYPFTNASTTPTSDALQIFARASASRSDARIATYHAGPALNLATLEGLQATLLSEIRTAHTFVAAESYFSRLASAGDTAHVAYKQPLTNYITSLVELGGAYWDTMLSSTSFVGVGIQGITVPLRDGMAVPTQNNFVAADLNQLTGLKGDASTKYIATNVAGTALSQNDASASVYQTALKTSGGGFVLGNNGPSIGLRTQGTQWINGSISLGGTSTIGLYGAARSTSTDIDVRNNQTDYSGPKTSLTPNTSPISLFAIGVAPSANSRLATYHVGPALNLATLEGLQATLITEVAAI